MLRVAKSGISTTTAVVVISCRNSNSNNSSSSNSSSSVSFFLLILSTFSSSLPISFPSFCISFPSSPLIAFPSFSIFFLYIFPLLSLFSSFIYFLLFLYFLPFFLDFFLSHSTFAEFRSLLHISLDFLTAHILQPLHMLGILKTIFRHTHPSIYVSGLLFSHNEYNSSKDTQFKFCFIHF